MGTPLRAQKELGSLCFSYTIIVRQHISSLGKKSHVGPLSPVIPFISLEDEGRYIVWVEERHQSYSHYSNATPESSPFLVSECAGVGL